MKQRDGALDALRGLAILLMVLSSSISFGILPAWMYHAQVPPPYHVFKPELAGITWVDLVFPFFLFTMGAAIPLALHKKLSVQSAFKVVAGILERYILLIVFAFFTFYARAWVMKSDPSWKEQSLSILCFFLLFLMYTQFKNLKDKKIAWAIKGISFILAAVFLAFFPFKNGFDLNSSDVILIVLANMALFAGLIWCITAKQPLLRIGFLPLIMAVFLTAKDLGSWNSMVFNWSPFPWMYKFYYLKYLFIVLPGTIAGDWLLQRSVVDKDLMTDKDEKTVDQKLMLLGVTFLCGILVISNVVALYMRWLVPNLLFGLALSALMFVYFRQLKATADKILWLKFAQAGIYLLILGLFFEAYEGGIKKDISTYSYYFVTTGLAFLVLLSFSIFEKLGYFSALIRYLGNNGKNPMVAYTAGNLLLIPLLKLSGADAILDSIASLPAGGFLRGLIFTGIVSLVTLYCTKKNLFWRT